MDVNSKFNGSNGETLAEAIDREQFELDAKKANENAQPLVEKWQEEFRDKHITHDVDDCSL